MEEITAGKTTTIKLKPQTKSRLDHLKVHGRETYEDVIKKMLDLLNLCKLNPLQARRKLFLLDKQNKEITH
jgi:hypothetical protein